MAKKGCPQTLATHRQGDLLVISANSSWNIVNFRSGLVRGLIERGYRVLAIAPRDEHTRKIEALGAEYLPIEMSSSGLSVFRDVRTLSEYRRMLRDLRPAAYLGFTVKPNIYGSIAAHALGIKVVNNISGLGTAFMKPGPLQTLVALLYRLALRKSSTVYFQNRDDRQLFIAKKLVRDDQARLLRGSGIDLVHFSPRPDPKNGEGTIRFLLVARMLRDKGVIEFVEAARLLLAEQRKFQFVLLGPAGADNRTAISTDDLLRWQAEGLVDFHGNAEDVRSHVALSDCVVLPSYREGLPRSLIEAAAMGKPVITTDVPGCRDVVDNNRTGMLCEPRSAASLANAMRRFASLSKDERRKMGRLARQKAVAEFGQAEVIICYAQALER